MRRAGLFLLLLSSVTSAQTRPTHAENVAAVQDRAKQFFGFMLSANARSLTAAAAFPFQLEGRKIATGDELFQEWLKLLRNKRTDLITLYGIEVFTPAEMERRYGAPPPRLAALPWRAPKTYLAVANLGGHGAVAIFRESPQGWRVVGYTD